jgi:inward rectifier potassium channel
MATRFDDNRDLGFGSVVSQESRRRLVNRDGTFNVVRSGLPFWASLSLYHALLRMSWPRFVALLGVAYLVINATFAGLYLLCGAGALRGPLPVPVEGWFLQAFFFSVETFGTIGYGNIYPVGVAPNLLMTLESFVGLSCLALSTGIIFARFARPTAKILFSRRAIVAPYHGMTAFEFRIMNQLSSQLVEVEVKVILSRIEQRNGKPFRNYYALSLERTKVSFFPLSWTVVHPIDETSPLRQDTAESLAQQDAEFIVLVTAFDETFSQTVHTRSSYRMDEVVWGARFADVFRHDDPRHMLSIDVQRLHEIERTPLPA